MNFVKTGSGKKLIVFLHGWGGSIESFFWIKDYFKDESLLFVDFPGFGKSPESQKPYFVSDYVFELKNIIDNFEIDDLILVGHSFGGRVAIKFAFLFQYCYKRFRVCLIDSAGIKPKRSIVYHLKVLRFKYLKKRASKNPKLKTRLNSYGSKDYKALSCNMKRTFVQVVNEDLSAYAKFLKCQTIIIWGRRDKETKMYMAKKLHKLINGSQLFVFENAGHFSYLDNIKEFLFILDTFIQN